MRVKLGLADPKPAPLPELRNADDSRARLMQKLELQIAGLRDEDEELELRAAEAAASGKRAEAARAIQRRKAIAAEVAECEGQLANQRSISDTLGRADTNREQTLLMRDAGTRVAARNKDTERLDIDEVVDNYREAAGETYDHSRRLAEPLTAGADPEELDAEVEALMQRAADERRLEMPTVVAAAAAGGGGGGGGTAVATVAATKGQTRQRKVAATSAGK